MNILVFQFFAIIFIKMCVFHYKHMGTMCKRSNYIHKMLLNTRGTASIVLLVTKVERTITSKSVIVTHAAFTHECYSCMSEPNVSTGPIFDQHKPTQGITRCKGERVVLFNLPAWA